MVDLPAPDLPIRPSTLPRCSVSETSSTMVTLFGGSPGG